ncbi:hypothetical protein G6F59_013428 [Rhizopus arrhizus]|nr:hypothetical protein G6F59_013428 [Rhizopus arrhizus]
MKRMKFSAVCDSSNSGDMRCRDRGRAFHRVRQPHVQRDLGRLAHGADEQADADDGGDRPDHRLVQQLHAQDRAVPDLQLGARVGQHAGRREHLRVVQGAEHPQHAGDAQQEAEVTDAVDQERLHVGEDRGRALEPEADQQVRHQAHRIPAEEQLEELVAHHQGEHREGEQRNVAEEPLVARVVLHVADRVDVDQQRHEGHHHHHHRGQLVDHEADVGRILADFEERVDVLVERLRTAPQQLVERVHRQAAGHRDAEDGDGLRAEALDLATEQAGDDAAEQRCKHHCDQQTLGESDFHLWISPSANRLRRH